MSASPGVRRRAFTWGAAIFAVEVLIATKLTHWRWVRSSLGDYLVVFLVYLGLLFLRPTASRRALALGTFAFAALVEASQALGLADILGLAATSPARIVLGATFAWDDLLMYGLGCLTCVWLDPRIWRRPEA